MGYTFPVWQPEKRKLARLLTLTGVQPETESLRGQVLLRAADNGGRPAAPRFQQPAPRAGLAMGLTQLGPAPGPAGSAAPAYTSGSGAHCGGPPAAVGWSGAPDTARSAGGRPEMGPTVGAVQARELYFGGAASALSSRAGDSPSYRFCKRASPGRSGSAMS